MSLRTNHHKSINNLMVYVARNDAVRAAKSHCTGIHIYIDMRLRLYETLATKCAGGIKAAVRFDAHGIQVVGREFSE